MSLLNKKILCIKDYYPTLRWGICKGTYYEIIEESDSCVLIKNNTETPLWFSKRNSHPLLKEYFNLCPY